MFKFIVALSLIAICNATISGDLTSVGVQTDQTIRNGLNTVSSYSKAVNTAHSQSFVSRSDFTSNPGIIAHPYAAVAPVAAAYHAPIAPIAAAYHAPIAPIAAAYHAPIAAAAYHAPIAAAGYPYAYKAAAAPVLYH